MKITLHTILAATLMLARSAADEIVTLFNVLPNNGPSQTITLAAGDTAELLYCQANENSQVIVTIPGQPARALNVWSRWPNSSGNPTTAMFNSIKIAGPATYTLTDGAPTIGTVKVTRAGTPTVTPSNAVVIPADAAGSFNVILESSTDMITWTAALPGTYSGATEKRFFRTRVVKQ